jgi:Na+/H+ antiporter NhaD/arsenite permease-like protein
MVMMATGPVLYARFWNRYYPLVAVTLGAIVVTYYVAVLGDSHHPIQTAFEFISFITVIIALYVVSGCITIAIRYEATPQLNVLFLLIAAVLSNFIGTEGASMLLIRPFINMNRYRLRPYLIVFFIFIVSNVAGGLTPMGDPPIFMGFLKGVPFFWSLQQLWLPSLIATGLLLTVFYFLDVRNKHVDPLHVVFHHKREVIVRGTTSFLWFFLIIGAVFLDPNIVDGLPTLNIEDMHFSFVREIIMIAIALLALAFANKKHLVENELYFEPVREVGFLFMGIFAALMPALHLMSEFALSESGKALNEHSLYWATGAFSSILDNTPSYLNMLAAAAAREGLSIEVHSEIARFAALSPELLRSISLGAVFFGAMTYVGNAPNLMVKVIATQNGIAMPSFAGYTVRYSIPYLLPVLLLTWLIAFVIL